MFWDLMNFIEAWIADHSNLVTVVGVPLLTFLVTYGLNRSAEARAAEDRKTERRLATELKLVDFRQEWINQLRSELVGYTAMVAAAGKDFDRWEEMCERIAKIELLMNPEDESYKELEARLTKLAQSAFSEDEPVSDTLENLSQLSQKILKREWERLKRDLRNVELGAQ